MPKGRVLTVKQTAFVGEYLTNGGNATQAAMKAGYSKKNAESIGLQQLRKTLVKQALEKAQAKVAKAHDITITEIVKNAREVIERSLQREAVLDSDGNPTGEYKYDSRGVLGGNEQLAKISGAYSPEKHEHTGKDGAPLTMRIIIDD